MAHVSRETLSPQTNTIAPTHSFLGDAFLANPFFGESLSWPQINWTLLAHAVDFYQKSGFSYKEVPWTASPEALRTTYPGYDKNTCKWLNLVGSAEQSFIQLHFDGHLPPGDYVALTPCFREEEVLDDTHQSCFMKVELFRSGKVTEQSLTDIIDICFKWFQSQCGSGTLEKVITENGVDINLNGIEVGSYGIHTYNGFSWIYATGHAEPRFSVALTQ